MKGKGRKETFPDVSAIVTYMKESAVTRLLLHAASWTLQLMCERPANRHDFTSQKPQTAKKSREDLEQTRAEFALDFWRTYAEAVSNDEVYIGGLTIRERNRSTFILVSFIGHIAHSLGNMVVQVVVGQLRLRIVVDKILNRT
ncbi:hypothetical protein PC128_g9307 [Phytophthora cactorum]|nr:hypothetical protein PC128_g9307 [Phytophthora cactorum]